MVTAQVYGGNMLRGLTLATAIAAATLLSNPLQAQTVRFVSSTGDDAAGCTIAAPCRTLQRGINRTPAGAELQILDSGAYGNSIDIRKSITITAHGVSATVGEITITGDDPNRVVALRGLMLRGTGRPAVSGLTILGSAGSVHVERCEIERFPQRGIFVDNAEVKLFISDTVVRANSLDGIRVSAAGTTSTLVVKASRFENNGADGLNINGIQSSLTDVTASGNTEDGVQQILGQMTVTRSTSAGNGSSGFRLGQFSGGGQMVLESSVSRGNGSSGVQVDSGNTLRISASVLTNNATGLSNGGTTQSRQNNVISGNTTNLAGAALQSLAGL
jgi:hypothetical protein